MNAPGLIRAPDHHCHAIGCNVICKPRFFMCFQHWRRLQFVAPALAKAVQDNYLPGQEIRKDPTTEYILAAAAARNALWLDELINGYEDEAQSKAKTTRRRYR